MAKCQKLHGSLRSEARGEERERNFKIHIISMLFEVSPF
jgi:hypothetical protein